jgi:hypothetical protein
MARTSQPDSTRQVIVGVDTHKYIHVAVALDQHGARLGELSVRVSIRRATNSSTTGPRATVA